MTTSDQSRKETAAIASIAASALLTIAKLIAGLLSGSLALLSEAGHGLLDTGATIMTYFALRAAHMPADDEHHYGHGKIEAVAALGETGLLGVLAIGVLVEAIRRLFGHEAESVDASWPVFAVLIVSIAVDLVRWRSLAKIARETKSDALAADALHFSSDLVGSTCVLLGLAATRFGFQQGDSLAAIAVAIFIGIAGYRLGRQTIDTLVDTAPKGLTALLRTTVTGVSGVVSIASIRLRPAGANVLGEITIGVPRTMPLERVSRVRADVASAVAVAAPEVNLTVTADPLALDDETVLEQVLLISARRRLAVHHVTVQDIGGRTSISLDVEFDRHMSLAQAHDAASSLEAAIVAELGPDVEVETHIEPLEVAQLAGRDVTSTRGAEILRLLSAAAARTDVVSDVHDVRVRETPTGLVVNYHCHADAALTVEAVHSAVDALDHALRQQIADVVRIVGHAEPLKD